MSVHVTVIDYGSGNLHSVINALRECGGEVLVTGEPVNVRDAERLVLPGVGAFADGMNSLQKRGLIEAIDQFLACQRPFLGICLGMQMLFNQSSEFGENPGLGLVPGRVVEIPRMPGFKVPHIGWSRIHPRPGGSWCGSILNETSIGSRVYFVHSFSSVPDEEYDRLADTYHGSFRVCAAIQKDNIIGCQFHPEKSGPIGLAMIRQFLKI